jgi:hypothetical protein
MKTIARVGALLLFLGCTGDDPDDTLLDAPLADGAMCTAAPPFDAGGIGLCSEAPRCGPAICLQCTQGPSGPVWQILGDDRCRRDAGASDASPRD